VSIKILIANRSEVALRIQAACRFLGFKTVAVYTQEDKDAAFVCNADFAYQLALSGYQGYRNSDDIIAIAKRAGVAGIHPGYGFLSENADFAQKVVDAGLVWIGPKPSAIRLMADKVAARCAVEKAGVSVVPGTVIHDLTEAGKQQALSIAKTIGFPVMLKDPGSGGGKGMRSIKGVDDFDRAWESVCFETAKQTGSKFLLLEKYLTHCRHVEVQVAGDGKRAVHFFERECSLQRRNQKIIEEAPCQFLPQETKDVLYRYALSCAHVAEYDSIGTVEFLVSKDNEIYFLEMNTRLQVEHSVTEMVTGYDLVALQLALALPHVISQHLSSVFLPEQKNIVLHGHAIQARLYAEDPANNFMPSSGTLHAVSFPSGPFLRVDQDLACEKEISPFFDPMLAKISAFGVDRACAITRLKVTLEAVMLTGVTTNISFLCQLLSWDVFVAGAIHTQLLADKTLVEGLIAHEPEVSQQDCMIAGLCALADSSHIDYNNVKEYSRSWKEQVWR